MESLWIYCKRFLRFLSTPDRLCCSPVWKSIAASHILAGARHIARRVTEGRPRHKVPSYKKTDKGGNLYHVTSFAADLITRWRKWMRPETQKQKTAANSRIKTSAACEQAFVRAGNFAIFFPKQRACSQASEVSLQGSLRDERRQLRMSLQNVKMTVIFPYRRVVTRYIFSSLIPIFSSKFWSLIPKCSKIWSLIPRKFYDPIERCDQVMFPRRRLSFINNN